MVKPHRLFGPAMIALSVLAAPAGAVEFSGLAGNAEVLWAVGTLREKTAQAATVRFRYRVPTQPSFRVPNGVLPVFGKVALLAALGPDLHVIYEDGSQWRCTPTGLQVSARIPAPGKPLAWTSSARGALYAVVRGSALLRLPAHRTPSTAPATRAAGASSAAATAPVAGAAETETTAADRPPLSRVLEDRPLADGLARFANGRWERIEDALIPRWLDGHRALWLAMDREAVHLFYEPGREGAQVMHARRPADSNRWSEPEPIGVDVGRPDPRAALAINERVLFIHAETPTDRDSGVYLRIVHPVGPAWAPGPRLRTGDQPRLFTGDTPAVTSFGQNVAVGERTGPREIRISTWNPQTGAAAGDEQTVSLERSQPSVIGEQMANLLLIIIVSILFFAALRRRQLARPKSGPGNGTNA